MSDLPFDEPLALLAEAFGSHPASLEVPGDGSSSDEPIMADTATVTAAAFLSATDRSASNRL